MEIRKSVLALAAIVWLASPPVSHGRYVMRRPRVAHASLVRETQRALNDRGYDVGAVDGIPGPRTRHALARFQRDHGIRPTGMLDRRTAAALRG